MKTRKILEKLIEILGLEILDHGIYTGDQCDNLPATKKELRETKNYLNSKMDQFHEFIFDKISPSRNDQKLNALLDYLNVEYKEGGYVKKKK
jgi:hypothetical protein